MGEARYLPARDYFGLKAASRALVEHNGGATDAAAITRADQPNISRQVGNDMDRFLAIDCVADLEAACGEPIVTRKLAEFADCLLIPVPRGARGDVLASEAATVTQEFGKLLTDFGAAVRDGSIHGREAVRVLEDIRELMTGLATLAEDIKARAGAGNG